MPPRRRPAAAASGREGILNTTAAIPDATASRAPAAKRRVDLFPYLLVAPTVLLILAFTILPAVYAFIMSLYKVDFVQLTDLRRLPELRQRADRSTDAGQPDGDAEVRSGGAGRHGADGVRAGVDPESAIARRGRFFRTAIMIPWVTTQVVSTLLVKWMLDFQFGFVNQLLRAVGLVPISFLGNAKYAMFSLVGITIWRVGGVRHGAAAGRAPDDPRRAVRGRRRSMAPVLAPVLDITMPLIRGPLLIMVVMESMGLVSLVTPILVLTGGGPADATEVLALRLFREAFTNFNMGAWRDHRHGDFRARHRAEPALHSAACGRRSSW